MREPDDEWSGVISVPDEVDEMSADERARTIAGRYEIVERIGEGGMGQVVLVQHRRLGKRFALKLMLAEMSQHAESRAMLHREARLASALSHPNIVSVVDFGEDPDWGLFIVMEYVDGELLSTRIANAERLPIELVCDVGLQLAHALDHSHANQVVHGDVKADNVVCITDTGSDPERWNVKLLDFGMAQVATAPAQQTGVAGTPEYLAPERIAGQTPAPSNDIYALGVILYEMLTGTVPFSGEPADVLQMHVSQEPEHVAAARGEVLDDSLVTIVERAMAKSVADRFESAVELASALRSYMDELGMRQRALEQRLAGDDRAGATADAFDALPIPAAGLSERGIIVVANPSFARLMRAESQSVLEGTSILDTPLAALHPDLREDLRLVAMDNHIVRRRLEVPRSTGESNLVRLFMTPASGSCGQCLLVLHSIPREP